MTNKPNYSLESIVGALAAIEDVWVKAPLRTAKVDLPISDELQKFYYNNTGDYMNGYLMAFWANVALTFGSEMLYNWSQGHLSNNNPIRKFSENIYGKHKTFNLISGVVSSAIVIMEETQGYFSTPDLKDIPMGIAGALTHIGLRYLSIRNYDNKKPKQQLSYEINSY